MATHALDTGDRRDEYSKSSGSLKMSAILHTHESRPLCGIKLLPVLPGLGINSQDY